MNFRDGMRSLYSTDFLAEQMMASFSGVGIWERRPGSRGPLPKWTANVSGSVTPEAEAELKRIAKRRGVSKSAIVREAVEQFLKGQPEAAQ